MARKGVPCLAWEHTALAQFMVSDGSLKHFYHLRDGQWEQLNHFAPPVWLEDIARDQAVVYARIFVLLQLRQPLLTNVDHDCGLCEDRERLATLIDKENTKYLRQCA